MEAEDIVLGHVLSAGGHTHVPEPSANPEPQELPVKRGIP